MRMFGKLINFFKRPPKVRYACPCCGYQALTEKPPGSHEICEICSWEDDPVQFEDPDFEGGANTASLKRAQNNFLLFGASEWGDIKNCRKPTEKDVKDPRFVLLEENKFKKIQIKDWVVVVDIESTCRANAKIFSGAERCTCDDCKWFAANREKVLPKEFKDLLNMFGVDYKKDIEVTCVDSAPNEKRYGGWYHVKGEVIVGGEGKVSGWGKGKVSKLRFVTLVPGFEILFLNKNDLASKDFPRPIFQIEFSATVKTLCDFA